MKFGLIAAIAAGVLLGLLLRRAWGKLGGRQLPAALRPGSRLPEFSARAENGAPLESTSLSGKPAVLLFVRGNWCPFCSRQVATLTKHYKSITDVARLVLVTPKPLETTRRVAEFFDFDFEFWLDEDLSIATLLGLRLSGGVPNEHRVEYGEDTLWPAAVVVDADQVIRYASVSKLIADRPNPQKLLKVLQSI